MSETVTTARIEEGRRAHARHAWREASEALRDADVSTPLEADDLERLGEASWWLGRLDDVIAAFERAYGAYQAAGLGRDAARAALRLSADLGHKREHAVAAGWLRRAERLLADGKPSPEQAALSRAHFNRAIGRGELEEALGHAEKTYAIAEHIGNADFLALGLHDRGRTLVARGDVEEGMALIDEATVAAVGGELGPHATAAVYCNTIEACRSLADYGRAGEWTDAAKRWCERQSIAGFPGICRIRRAEIVRLRGAWPEAEREARLATDELGTFYLDYAADGFYELGEIRLRMGDLGGAEDHFRQAAELGRDPQPGLALLRLAEGRPDAAAAMLRRATEGEPPTDRLARARLLPAQVEVALAVGDRETAARATAALRAIAETYGTPALRASAESADAAQSLARSDHPAAVSAARRAVDLWREVDAPYEASRARVTLGVALRAAGEAEPGDRELEGALAAFERLGADPDAEATRRVLGRDPTPQGGFQRVDATFMFTDVVGSTQLVEAIGDHAWENILRWHDETLQRVVAEHTGDVVKHTGDGFLVAFAGPAAALEAARGIQRSLAQHRREHGFAPPVRIGVHMASGIRHGTDYSGSGVHAAARIAALAGEGEILASVETLAGAGGGGDASKPRRVRLKGISRPVEVVSVEWR